MASLDKERSCEEQASVSVDDDLSVEQVVVETQDSQHSKSHSAKKRRRKRKKKGRKDTAEGVINENTEDKCVDDLTKAVGELKLDAKDTREVGITATAVENKAPDMKAVQNKADTKAVKNISGDSGAGKNAPKSALDGASGKSGSVDPSTPRKGEGAATKLEGQTSSKRKRNRQKKKKNTSEDDAIHRENLQHVDGKDSAAENRTPRKQERALTRTPNRTGSATKNTISHNKRRYEKYWSLEDVSSGLKRGELVKGPLRISKRNYELAWVAAPDGGRDILLEGMLPRNRALDGDIVALDILPRNKWKIMNHEYDAHKMKMGGAVHDGSTPSKKDTKSAANESQNTPRHGTKDKGQPTPSRNEDVPDAFLQKTAHVVYIIEKKHTRAASGHLKPFNNKQGSETDGLFSPTDSRLPRIRIPHNQCPPGFFDRPQDFANSLFVARITEWNENSSLDNYFAIGQIARSLGEAGEIEPETEGIFFEYGIDSGPFPDDALACLPQQTPWSIPEKELTSRRDFRDECVFTIDPLTARDLDDALHCKRLPDGLIEVGVHIADVSYFLRQGTALDDIAQDRATSTYMVQTVVPMLPRRLCEELCSLNPDVDRLTFSVVWIMTDKGEIRSDWKGRGIIRSRIKMAYEHAQEMINKPNKKWELSELPTIAEGTDVSDISSRVNLLNKIARHLKRNRIENGALRLDQAKLQFDLDKETGLPIGYHVHQQRDSNKLIEEFMLLANMTVAHHIYNAFPDMALLRRHPKPHQKQLDDLLELCKNLGIKFNASSSKAIQVSLAQFPIGSAMHEILVQLTMRPMKNAVYFSSGSLSEEEYGHYALSVPLYTHFTSPIRRYPDVIVHRLLAASLGIDEPLDKDAFDVESIASNCNDRRLAAKHAGELSNELFFAIFVRECGPLEEDGVVLAVMDQSFDVFVPALGVTKRIFPKYCPGVKRYEPYNKKEHEQPEIKLVWGTGTEKNPGKDIVQVLHICTKVRVILTTESQTEDKNKHVKVYAKLQPPKAGPAEQDCSPVAGLQPKKLFDSKTEEVPVNDNSDDVIVETESAEESDTEDKSSATKADLADQTGREEIGIEQQTSDDVIVETESEEESDTEDKSSGRKADLEDQRGKNTREETGIEQQINDDVIVESEEESESENTSENKSDGKSSENAIAPGGDVIVETEEASRTDSNIKPQKTEDKERKALPTTDDDVIVESEPDHDVIVKLEPDHDVIVKSKPDDDVTDSENKTQSN